MEIAHGLRFGTMALAGMTRIKTEQLLEGMVVAADVKNMDDMLLLPAGSAITERSIRILAAWGVEQIQVEASDDQAAAGDAFQSLPPQEQEKLTKQLLDTYFKDIATCPVQLEIFRLALTRRALQMREGNLGD
jgi:hypothetical protein